MFPGRLDEWCREADLIAKVLENAPDIDKNFGIQRPEFEARQRKVIEALEQAGIDAAIVYSDEHYDGDVPYLGGNTNISIEPVAGIIGKNGFHIMAGLEGGYIAEQLTPRSGARVHKVEMLKLADEDYPIDAERVEDVIEEAASGRPRRIGLLTPRAVLPVSIYSFLVDYMGSAEKVVDAQEIYYRIKYEKSDAEMKLIEDASKIADVMVRGMLAVLKPGMLETQVAAWGYAIARELGAEELGFDVMVTANEANRTLIGKALNRRINEGDYVHIGVAPKRDGLTACERVSVVAVSDPSQVTAEQRYWFDFVEEAFRVGLEAYKKVAEENLPARLQEQALVDYFASRADEVSARIGRKIDLTKQKPYTGTHNAGYTECQEFYGAITLNSNEPLGHQIVTMLDVAIRGIGNRWDDVIIPGLDYLVVEKTLGKFGRTVRVLNELPVNVQHLVGNAG
ncbi:MAG: M24 family metallopeptidase [Firmicutes bacterium]|nr:M24 family metallopeptidase [Bacillota bacterium]